MLDRVRDYKNIRLKQEGRPGEEAPEQARVLLGMMLPESQMNSAQN